jgi:hypothetical protein
VAKKDQNIENGEDTQEVVERRASDINPVVNHDLIYRRDHPGDRCSYGIAGVPGIVVFDKGLFADPSAPPPVITLNIALQSPRLDKKASKAEEAAAKAQAKADKEAQKVKAAAEKAAARQAKADEALRKAREKAEAAAAALKAKTEATSTDAPAQ